MLYINLKGSTIKQKNKQQLVKVYQKQQKIHTTAKKNMKRVREM